jgi:DNA-binding response OmpR family regulator
MLKDEASQLNFLIVEDDDLEWTLTHRALQSVWKPDPQCFRAKGVREAVELLQKTRVDVVLLDLNVIDSEGLKTVEALVPFQDRGFVIIVTTSMNDKKKAIEALKLGAQDYIVKGEFSPADLLRAVEFARARAPKKDGSVSGPVQIDFSRQKLISTATGEKFEVELTSTEIKLMSLLLKHINQPVTRKDLSDFVLGADVATSERTIDNQVSRLRAKLEGSGLYIAPIRGVGYRLEYTQN